MDVNLIMFKKNGSHKTFQVPNSVTVVGRRQDCELCIPLVVVSKRHCEFYQDRDKLTLRDLGSKNGTFVNGNRVDEAQVKGGDKVTIGPVSFTVQLDGTPSTQEIMKFQKEFPTKVHDKSNTKLSETGNFGETMMIDFSPESSMAEMLTNIRDEVEKDNSF